MERATKAALTTPHLQTEEVEIPGVGAVVLRGLSRWETVELQGLESNRQWQDTKALLYGLVDPPMDEHEIVAWRKAGGNGEVEAIARKINTLSGIGQDATKSSVATDGDESGA